MALLTSDEFYGQSVTVDDRYYYYPPEHLWVEDGGNGIYRFGFTHAGVILVNGFKYMDFAVEPGEVLDVDDSVLFVETFKAMFNVTTPIAGEVLSINEKLAEDGIKILEEKYFEEFIFELKCEGPDVTAELLNPQQYMEALLRGDSDHCGAGARVMRRNR